MEVTKRCTNCGRFPFCKQSPNIKDKCWIKRDVQTHLKNKDGEIFEFGRIKD